MASPRPRSIYTEENLRPAVAAASTLGEVLAHLGLEDRPKRRRYVAERIKALGIDGSHLRRSALLYTDEMLATAVAESATMVEVAQRIGATPVGGTIHHLRKRVDHLGLDTSHFRLPRRARNAVRPQASSAGFRREGRRLVVDEQMLREIVPREYTTAAVVRALGLEVSGPRHRAVNDAIARLGLDVSHFRGQGHLKGRASRARLAPGEILRLRPEQLYRSSPARLRRAIVEVGVPEVCDKCGTGPEWYGEKMTLEVDHLNGDFRDNRLENLRLLCPNCHATTQNYCRRKPRRDAA